MEQVLMIDDDTELCEMVAEYLLLEGFQVESVHDGARGVEEAMKGSFAIVLLDVMLPRVSGFEVLRRIRASAPPASQIPVLMLTARGDAVDRIVGLEVGADDYLSKPFDERELVARMRAILRRTRPQELPVEPGGAELQVPAKAAERLRMGDVEVDIGARSVRRGEQPIDLTAVEFDLLVLLLRQAGSVVSREDIARSVLDRRLTPFDRSIDTHVSHLRRKLGPYPPDNERIKTVRGVGYVYVLNSEE